MPSSTVPSPAELSPAALIIGASSGIGRALAQELAACGFRLGLAARRVDLLETLRAELVLARPGQTCLTAFADLTQPEAAREALDALGRDLGDVSLWIVNAGTGFRNAALDWSPEDRTVAVNVRGFVAAATLAARALEARGGGQLVGISSVAALRGHREAPAYGASKAFMSSYLEALRHRFSHLGLPIAVTEIRPGFVDTAMAQGDRVFWRAQPREAARQIHEAIRARRKVAYVTRRWRLVAWLMRGVPDAVYHRT